MQEEDKSPLSGLLRIAGEDCLEAEPPKHGVVDRECCRLDRLRVRAHRRCGGMDELGVGIDERLDSRDVGVMSHVPWDVTRDALKRPDRLAETRTKVPVAQAALKVPDVTSLIRSWREREQLLDRRVRERATTVRALAIGDPVVAGFDVPAGDLAAPRVRSVDEHAAAVDVSARTRRRVSSRRKQRQRQERGEKEPADHARRPARFVAFVHRSPLRVVWLIFVSVIAERQVQIAVWGAGGIGAPAWKTLSGS